MTKQYELLYIVPGQYADTEIDGIMSIVEELLKNAGGTITRQENLGKIKLAYQINRVRHGSYILVQFTAEPSSLQDLERRLRLTDEVLRHQIVLMPPGAETRQYELSDYVAPLSEEGRKLRKKAAVKKTAQAEATEETKEKQESSEKEEKKEDSADLKSLDKKLDELIDKDLTEKA